MLTDILSKLLNDISKIANFNISYSIGDKTIVLKIYETTLKDTLYFYWQDKQFLWNQTNNLLLKAKQDILKNNAADIQLQLVSYDSCLSFTTEDEHTNVFSAMCITLDT